MIPIVERSVLKKKILDACIAKQQALISDFRQRIKSLMETEGLGNEESYDNNVLAGNQQKVAEINMLNEQLEFANKEMRVLEGLRATVHLFRDTVSPGAVVITNRRQFFVSASLELFTVDGDYYVGISASSPIFLSMKGKQKGENFHYEGVAYKIKDIF